MTNEQLQKGKELEKKIKNLTEAYECFEWKPYSDYPGYENTRPVSTNPRIIIEYDDGDDGRTTTHLPMELSDSFVAQIKLQISAELEALNKELDEL